MTVEEAFKAIGGIGRFHVIMMFIVIIGLNSMGVFTMAITFLELEPVYKCTYVNPDTKETRVETCDREVVCESEDTSLVSYEVDTESIYSLNNWN